jgi:hypothetical protein
MEAMTRKHKLLFYSAFSSAIYLFFIILVLSSGRIWPNILFALLFGSGVVIPIYWKYHFRHSGKEEKKLMIAQKQINSVYYNRWYTPADSTELDYQIERIKKRKQPVNY